MATTSFPEIIDLTESSPPPEVIDLDSDVGIVTPNNTGRENGKRRARRKKKRIKTFPEDGEVVESSVPASRDRSRESDNDRRRSRSPQPLHKSRSPQPRDNFADIFFVDVEPAPVPDSAKVATKQHGTSSKLTKLLLPDHVSILEYGEGGKDAKAIEIIRPSTPNPTEDEDFIEYVDYDDQNKDGVRYFDALDEASKSTRIACKNCGAEGEHKTFECPVQICLTCGARNEHSTRGCPISKTCYSCDMRGHISQNCPNRHSRTANLNSEECDRCGSRIHRTNECPTWWRIYDYVSDEERLTILQARKVKQNLEFGKGGEAYIGSDEFCYNCASSGHWGDNCNELPHPPNVSREHSAFSIYNTMSGPFFDPTSELAQYKANRHDYDLGDAYPLPDDWGVSAPVEVGKQGRRKDRAKMEQRFKEQQSKDDPDDWFDNSQYARNRGMLPAAPARPPATKKISFGKSIKDVPQFQPPRTLLDRLGAVDEHTARQNDRRGPVEGGYSIRIRGASYKGSGDTDYASRGSRRQGRHDRDRGWDRNDSVRDRRRDRDEVSRKEDRGPRYKGGYTR